MKKLLLMIVAILFICIAEANAQKFEFQYHGESVADGVTVTIAAEEDDLGRLCCATNPSSNPNDGLVLKLLTGSTASGKAMLDIENNVLSPNPQWCMGGECLVMYNEENATKNFSTTNGIVQVQFDAEDIQNQGALVATLSATIDDETHTVRILFTSVSASTNGQKWWGYFTESDIKDYYCGYGSGIQENHDAAIFIPANHAIAGGACIKGIRIWLDYGLDPIWPAISDVKVWISKRLPERILDADYVQDVNVASLKEGFNEIILNTSYPIQEQGIYVGYSVGLDLIEYPIMAAGKWEENSFFCRSSESSPEWHINWRGKLGLQVLLDGEMLPDYADAAVASDFGNHIVEIGKNVSVPVRIKNIGTNPISSISYTITTNGITSMEENLPLYNLPFVNDIDISIPFQADEDTRRFAKTLTITKVNGKANEASKATAEGSLITILEKPVAVPVVEEFTGTWCGWCPIGIDGMEKAKETFGDSVVLIAVHFGDVMQTDDYAPIISTVSSYPISYVNRFYGVYPEASNLKTIISEELKKNTLGTISLDAEWNNTEQTAIKILAKTQFVYSDNNGQYGIAYVLVEDGLKGSGSEWCQTNYLSNDEGFKDFTFWYNAPSKVSDLEFDHVPVAAWNIEEGGKIKSDFIVGEILDDVFMADISTNTIIQDKSKLSVVALLIDQTTGAIINAAQTDIQEATGITSIGTHSSQIDGYYSIDGKRRGTPIKGLTILHMNDGTVRKVISK